MRKRLAEMGQRRKPARRTDRLDRADRAESGARHVRGAAAPDEPLERILDARRMTCADERPGDRRPAERVVIAQVELGEWLVDRQPELAQTGDGPLEPFAASRSLGREDRFELVVRRVHAEAEDVELALPQVLPIDDGVDLDAGDQLEAVGHRARGQDVAAARQRVVVGQRQQPDTGSGGRAQEDRRLEDAVRARRVGVEVDRRGSRRDDGIGRRPRIVPARGRPGRHAIRARRGAGPAPAGAPGPSPGRCRPAAR